MRFPPTSDEARISEIFSSLQGEGVYAGQRHIFVRFEECHIHCRYCDELGKPAVAMTRSEALQKIRAIEAGEGPHSFVSFTGGEPLIYLPFLKPLLEDSRREGYRNYLETDGILWKSLEKVRSLCDCIAMDMKPASVTGERNFYEEHRQFLRTAGLEADLFIKIVLSSEADREEFEKLIDIVREERPRTPVILQPLSGEAEGHEAGELLNLLADFQKFALTRISDVRIVPRWHRILGIR